MDVEKTKDIVKLTANLAVGFGVSKVVKDGVEAVTEPETRRDKMRVKVGGWAIGSYVAHRVKAHVDDQIDRAFDLAEKIRIGWAEAVEAKEAEEKQNGSVDTTAEEIKVEEPAVAEQPEDQ